jgi:flavin reductase (DIM6/NTAB) family NADH-FMN oxidoreductase RutF
MYYETDKNDHGLRYNPLKACVVPRPIGWLTTTSATGEFVYNMATWAQRDQMNQTALIIEHGVDEMAATGLEPLPSRLVRPPRVKGSPVHFECRLHQIVTLPGHKPSSEHHVVIGQVVAVHIDDAALTDGRVDVVKMRPIARLGYKDYASVDSMFQMEKRTPEDYVVQGGRT